MEFLSLLHVFHFFWLLGLPDQLWVQVALRNFTYLFELCDHVEKLILVIVVLPYVVDKPDLSSYLSEFAPSLVFFFTTRLWTILLQTLDFKFELSRIIA